jgi:hypothetical protein
MANSENNRQAFSHEPEICVGRFVELEAMHDELAEDVEAQGIDLEEVKELQDVVVEKVAHMKWDTELMKYAIFGLFGLQIIVSAIFFGTRPKMVNGNCSMTGKEV